MDVNIRNDWESSGRVKEALLTKSSSAIFDVGMKLRRAFLSGARVFVYGRDHLALLAEYGSRLFLSGGVTGYGERMPLFALTSINDLEMVGGDGEVLLWLNYISVENSEAKAFVSARSSGAQIYCIGGEAGEFLEAIADIRIDIPSRHQVVLSEVLLAVLHSLYKVASETEEIEPLVQNVASNMTFWGPSAEKPPQKNEVYNPIAPATASKPVMAPLPSQSSSALTRRGAKVVPPTRNMRATGRIADERATRELERPASDRATRATGLIADERATRAIGRPETERKPRRAPAIKTLRFRCGSCEEIITVDRRYMGKKGQCPFCLDEFMIPADPDDSKETTSSSQVREALREIADKAKRRERRRCNRFEVIEARALFKLKGAWHEDGEPIEDVSLSGVGVRLINREAAEFELNSEVMMALDFPAFMEPLRVNGCLRRISENARDVCLGFEFTEFKKDAEKKLKRLVQNVALRGIHRT